MLGRIIQLSDNRPANQTTAAFVPRASTELEDKEHGITEENPHSHPGAHTHEEGLCRASLGHLVCI